MPLPPVVSFLVCAHCMAGKHTHCDAHDTCACHCQNCDTPPEDEPEPTPENDEPDLYAPISWLGDLAAHDTPYHRW